MHQLNETSRVNLARLATKLESLPEQYKHFEMNDYIGINLDDPAAIREAEVKYALKNGGLDTMGHDLGCNTVACAVGHGPSAGILVPEDLIDDDGTIDNVDWHEYAQRFFLNHEEYNGDVDTNYSDPFFQFLFGGTWTIYDNHHWGAAARIRYLLDHIGPPRAFYEDANFKAAMEDYAKYRVSEPQPLPADFYPKSMLAAL